MPNVRVFLPCVVAVAACGTTVETLPLRPFTARPRPPITVEVFATGTPTRPYYEVARMQAHGAVSPSALQLTATLRERAAQLGCDGLVIEPLGHHEDPHHTPDLVGTCIMFLQTMGAPGAGPVPHGVAP